MKQVLQLMCVALVGGNTLVFAGGNALRIDEEHARAIKKLKLPKLESGYASPILRDQLLQQNVSFGRNDSRRELISAICLANEQCVKHLPQGVLSGGIRLKYSKISLCARSIELTCPLCLSLELGHARIARRLILRGVDPSHEHQGDFDFFDCVRTYKYHTPLEAACSNAFFACIRLLLVAGVKQDHVTRAKNLARANGFSRVVNMLSTGLVPPNQGRKKTSFCCWPRRSRDLMVPAALVQQWPAEPSVDAQNQCPICSEELGVEVATTKCNHRFHTSCLLTWRRNPNHGCPLCRANLETGAPEGSW